MQTPGEALCPPQIGTIQWIEVEVGVAGGNWRQVVVRRLARVEGIDLGEPPALRDEGRPVDGVVDRPPQTQLREERPACVHVQVARSQRLADEVLLMPGLRG